MRNHILWCHYGPLTLFVQCISDHHLFAISCFLILQITSTAGGATLTLEFGILSRLTNDPGTFTVVYDNIVHDGPDGLLVI